MQGVPEHLCGSVTRVPPESVPARLSAMHSAAELWKQGCIEEDRFESFRHHQNRVDRHRARGCQSVDLHRHGSGHPQTRRSGSARQPSDTVEIKAELRARRCAGPPRPPGPPLRLLIHAAELARLTVDSFAARGRMRQASQRCSICRIKAPGFDAYSSLPCAMAFSRRVA